MPFGLKAVAASKQQAIKTRTEWTIISPITGETSRSNDNELDWKYLVKFFNLIFGLYNGVVH